MLRRDRALWLTLALFCLLPSVAMAGQGGSITFVNGTPYNWINSNQQQNQMNWWGFPSVIPAGSTFTQYVEWSQGIFEDWSEDWGVVTFSLQGTDQSFQLQASRVAGNFDLRVVLTNLSTAGNPQGSTIDLGWNHDGIVNFVLAGEAGTFTSSGAPNAWMHENLSVLGNRSLRHLCIPGSHDAGMSQLSSGTFWGASCNAITQTQGVLQQLQAGVRYFDIRPVISGGQFYSGHYSCDTPSGCQGANGQSLASIIQDVNSYTAANKELVVLYLSHDLNTDIGRPYPSLSQDEWNTLLSQLELLNHRYALPLPEASSVDLTALPLESFIADQAAVVVVTDPDPNSNMTLGDFASEGFYTTRNFPLINWYSNSDDLGFMQNDQLAKLRAQRPNPNANDFLLSWTLTQVGNESFDCLFGLAPSVLDLATEAYPSLFQQVLPASNGQTFPNILYIDNVQSFDIAALAMAVNTKASWNSAYMFYKGSGPDTFIYVAHSPDSNLADGSAWGATPLNPGINTSDAPAAVSFNGSPYVFYKGSGGDSRIYVAQPPTGSDILNGPAWSANPLNPAINTSTAPAVAAFNGALYMLYKGSGGDTNVYIGRSTANTVGDGSSWSANRLNPAINTSAAPAVATLNQQLYMLYKGSGGDTNIYIASSTGGDIFDGSTWSATRLNPAINTSVAPGIVVFNGTLYMFYKGSGNDTNIYIAKSTGGNILDGNTWSATRLNVGINTVAAPRPVVVGSSLYLFYMGSGGDTKIWVAQPSGDDLFNGDAWQTQPLNPGINTSTAPGAAVM